MKLTAPAKVNFHLRVLGRRPDGFHDLETLMVPVSLADEIAVTTSPGRTKTVVCDNPDVPTGAENLAVRAAEEFFRRTGREFSARITITKRIPMGAGLGGGSSDAAAVLLALDTLLQTRLGVPELERLAATLGSDVPFFIRRQPAWCRGRGEIIDPCGVPDGVPLLLIKPPFGVATPWAYKQWSAGEKGPDGDDPAQDLGWVRVVNDLEGPVFKKFLLLPVMKSWLRGQPEVRAAAMSGSGSTLFAVLREGETGGELEQRVKACFGGTMWTARCHTLGTSDEPPPLGFRTHH